MNVTIDLAVLLAVVIFIRLRRRTEARSRNDELLTVAIVLVFGLLLAGTETGKMLLGGVGGVVRSIQ